VDSKEEQTVLQFIVEQIDTVPHLEALLLICQDSTTTWTGELLSARIYVSPATAGGVLEDLCRRGFIKTVDANSRSYLYDASWDTSQLMAQLADLYRRQLVRVTKLIHSKGSSSVREFARAFQIKKEQ